MAESRYCYKCHCTKNEDVLMEFNPRQGPYGGYTCPKCGYSVDKKTSGDTDEKYA